MEILATLAVLALVVLVIFIVQTLLTLQSTLKKLDLVLMESEIKLRKFTSLINTIENVSDITEKETIKLKQAYECKEQIQRTNELIDPEELATWLISSLKIGVNFFKKR